MRVDWLGLAEGIRNTVIPKKDLEGLIQETQDERMAICNGCEFKNGDGIMAYCGKCGCNLKLKTKCLSCNCPIEKWTQKITRADDDLVKQKLNEY